MCQASDVLYPSSNFFTAATGVFLGPDFVVVTKKSQDPYWGALKVEIASVIIDFFASGAPVVAEGVEMHK
jgi:hypothetical protein